MRVRLAFVYLSISMGALFIAAAPPQAISSAEAAAHIGDTLTVCGRVEAARWVQDTSGRPTYLNFDRGFPNQTLAVVIWPEARKKFKFPPEETFRGKRVCVRGTIRKYRDKPQIEVEEPSQIWIAEGQ